MANHDTRNKQLLELVKERVRLSGRSHRDLERELDLGHGTLGNILRGRTELRLRHVAMLGKALGFDPADLLGEVYGPAHSAEQTAPLPPKAAHVTREELRAIVAETVRAVLQDPAILEALQDTEEDLP